VLKLDVDETNIDYLESASREEIFVERERQYRESYRRIPALDELCARYGDWTNRKIYVLSRDVEGRWMDLHERATGTKTPHRLIWRPRIWRYIRCVRSAATGSAPRRYVIVVIASTGGKAAARHRSRGRRRPRRQSRLFRFGIRHINIPTTPFRIWTAIRTARAAGDAPRVGKRDPITNPRDNDQPGLPIQFFPIASAVCPAPDRSSAGHWDGPSEALSVISA
jgi:hypothetical protein